MKTKIYLTIAAASVLYAFVVVWGGTWAFYSLHELPFPLLTRLNSLIALTTVAFLPFLLFLLYAMLAYRHKSVSGASIRIRRALFSGLLVSLGIWSYYFYEGITNSDAGANIGLGMLMIASPVLILLFMLVGVRIGRRIH